MSELISVIVPVYNCKDYLDKCHESLVNQTYENLEIIYVDDGSTDGSELKLKEFAKKDKRIKLLSTKHCGVSAARNAALNNLTGEFVTFIDSDDFVENDYVQKLYENLKQTDSDISICTFNEVVDGKKVLYTPKSGEDVVVNVDDDYDVFAYYATARVWGTLLKSSILFDKKGDRLNFRDDIAIAEDKLFFVSALMNSQKISYFNAPLYNYVQRKDSAMNKAFNEKKVTSITAHEGIAMQFKLKGLDKASLLAQKMLMFKCYDMFYTFKENKVKSKKLKKFLRKKLKENLSIAWKTENSFNFKLKYTLIALFGKM